MIKPLFNAQDDEWVVLVGRYMLNIGAVEMATRLLIVKLLGTDSAPIFYDDLVARLGFVRKRFPRTNAARHKWAMNVFEVASKHAGFRNIIAHSPLAMSNHKDGSLRIHGIMNLTPKDQKKVAEIISLEELRGRVNESAALGRNILEMQQDFPGNTSR